MTGSPAKSREFKRGLSVQAKLLLGFGGVVAVFLSAVTVNLVEQNRVSTLMNDVLQRESKMRLIQTLDYDVRKAVDDGSWYLMSPSPAVGKPFLENYHSSVAVVNQDLVALRNETNEAQGLLAVQAFQKDWSKFTQRANAALAEYGAGNQIGAQASFTHDTVDTVVRALTSDTNRQKQDIATYETQMRVAKRTAELTNISMSTVAFLLALGIALVLSRRISGSIRRLRDATSEIAGGNLGVGELQATSGDEIGQLVHATNTMVQSLRTLVRSIHEAAEQLSASSEELAASSEQTTQSVMTMTSAVQVMSDGTDRQSQHAAQTQLTIKEMSTGVQSTAQAASSIADRANAMAEQAMQGNDFMATTVDRMKSIHDAVGHSASIIQKLEDHSREIKQIVTLISNIAAQTNLLALNAAIEAARAGDEGRGFSVVAEEVRKLAQQSDESAQNIGNLIQSIERDISESVSTMTEVKSSVTSGVSMVDDSARSFQQILEANQAVAAEIEDLSASSEQVAAAIQEVSTAVSELAHIAEGSAAEMQSVSAGTQEQMAAMEEVTASANALSTLAQDLHVTVQKFRL